MVLGDKLEKMEKIDEDVWNSKDKKAGEVITLSRSKSDVFNIINETMTSGTMGALSNMYEKPPTTNKVFLMRELLTTRMNEEILFTIHINNLNSILCRLSSVGINFDDEIQVALLLTSLSDSWSGTVTVVTSFVGASVMTFEGVIDLFLGEDIRCKNQGESSSFGLLNMERGRQNNRNSGSNGSRGKSSSRTWKNVKCWNCQEVVRVKSQYPNPKKGLNIAGSKNVSEDDTLLLSMESSVDSWVVDSGASFQSMDKGETMVNLKHRDFRKLRLENDEILKVTGMGDIDLVTSLGTTLNLKNVGVILDLKKKLIYVGQLDE